MMELSNANDEELLERLIAGEEQAFVTFYRRWSKPVYRFAFHMSGSESVAEEVTQEVFLILIRGKLRYDADRGSILGYIFGIARHHVLRCLERDRPYIAMETGASEIPANGSVLGQLLEAEREQWIRKAVLELPAPYREAVALCHLQEMSYEEAAQALGCAIGTVRSRLSRGRALLAEKLRRSQTLVRGLV